MSAWRALPGLALLALLASCGGGSAVPVTFEPLRYDYLTPIRLNVATVDIEQSWTPVARHP